MFHDRGKGWKNDRLQQKTKRKEHIPLSRIIIPFNQLARQESEAIEETIRRLG